MRKIEQTLNHSCAQQNSISDCAIFDQFASFFFWPNSRNCCPITSYFHTTKSNCQESGLECRNCCPRRNEGHRHHGWNHVGSGEVVLTDGRMCGSSEGLHRKVGMTNWPLSPFTWISLFISSHLEGPAQCIFYFLSFTVFPVCILLYFLYVAQHAFIFRNLPKQATKALVYNTNKKSYCFKSRRPDLSRCGNNAGSRRRPL